jgi:glycosyltransferase involved in cell wall biosynthesis
MMPITIRGEREAVRGSDLNLVLSVQDRDLLRKRYDPQGQARIEVQGGFEYKDRPMPVRPEKIVEDPVFVVTGNLGARQTLDSLLPWLDDYWPLIRKRVPESRLIAAGKNPGKVLQDRLKALGAECVANPSDMDGIVTRGRYYVCPASMGGGVKLRVMDGLRAGLPVLVHRVSARGYETFENRSLFVYDSPDSFRTALEDLLSCTVDPSMVLEMYTSSYSFRSGVLRLSSFLRFL